MDGHPGDFSYERTRQVGVPRLTLTRHLGAGGHRYLRFTSVAHLGGAWAFEVLGGAYGDPDATRNFDGRWGGSLEDVVALAQRFLVELEAWPAAPA